LEGDRRSGRLTAHGELILQIYRARPQLFLRELRAALQEHWVEVSTVYYALSTPNRVR
jgi:hypothetical protein